VASAEGAVDPAAWRDLVADAVRCVYAARFEAVPNAFPVPEIDLIGVPSVTPGAKLGLCARLPRPEVQAYDDQPVAQTVVRSRL
jgi:hypothetical protein